MPLSRRHGIQRLLVDNMLVSPVVTSLVLLKWVSSVVSAPSGASPAKRAYNDLTLGLITPDFLGDGGTSYSIRPVTSIGPDHLEWSSDPIKKSRYSITSSSYIVCIASARVTARGTSNSSKAYRPCVLCGRLGINGS